jgi:hypothetical protein
VKALASYDLKLDRAEKHLIELEEAIDEYVTRRTFTVHIGIEGKKKRAVHRFRFTEQPDPTVSIIVGDFIYNIRSALDHLRTALVPKKRERSGYFPIHVPGVWEPTVGGEDDSRRKERGLWETETLGMKPQAIAILKRLQDQADSTDIETPPALTAINRIAVKDRHSKLPVLAATLLDPVGTCRMPNARRHGPYCPAAWQQRGRA